MPFVCIPTFPDVDLFSSEGKCVLQISKLIDEKTETEIPLFFEQGDCLKWVLI